MSASAPGRAPTPSAGPAEGRPFSLEMIHGDLLEIREALYRVATGGDGWSASQVRRSTDKIDQLITRIAIEKNLGNVAR